MSTPKYSRTAQGTGAEMMLCVCHAGVCLCLVVDGHMRQQCSSTARGASCVAASIRCTTWRTIDCFTPFRTTACRRWAVLVSLPIVGKQRMCYTADVVRGLLEPDTMRLSSPPALHKDPIAAASCGQVKITPGVMLLIMERKSSNSSDFIEMRLHHIEDGSLLKVQNAFFHSAVACIGELPKQHCPSDTTSSAHEVLEFGAMIGVSASPGARPQGRLCRTVRPPAGEAGLSNTITVSFRCCMVSSGACHASCPLTDLQCCIQSR